ncbi:hypothetical protein [Burkholderia gladioli]|uniref:hypothetical protein n=1 Tax=Burkholderia gladioli TaxID=28095 RepID=UPI001641FECC|nr:hypothetical protein [Burkholderia gladioli]
MSHRNRNTFTSKQRKAIEAQREALWDAVQGNDPDRLRALLREPSTLDFPQVRIAYHAGPHKFISLLHVASQRGYAEVCRVLLDAGAALESTCDFNDRIDAFYPLDMARMKGHHEVIRLLEQECDRQGVTAETMEPRIETTPNGDVLLSVVNAHTGDTLGYGRAGIAQNEAMEDPLVMQQVIEHFGMTIDENTFIGTVSLDDAEAMEDVIPY